MLAEHQVSADGEFFRVLPHLAIEAVRDALIDGAEIDPVPFLDRAEKRPNGAINGRERLVPGDRILWFRPMAEGLSCKMAMFEIEDYCQVIGRTWNPQLTEEGWPLLLEYPAADEQPECIIRTTRAALRLPRPLTWELRNPDPEDGGRTAAAYAAPPEYWLPQLAQQNRAAARRSTGKRWAASQLPLWLPNEAALCVIAVRGDVAEHQPDHVRRDRGRLRLRQRPAVPRCTAVCPYGEPLLPVGHQNGVVRKSEILRLGCSTGGRGHPHTGFPP